MERITLRRVLAACFIVMAIACGEPGTTKTLNSADAASGTDAGHGESSTESAGESQAELRTRLVSEGFEVFDYVDEKTGDTVLMQQYFIAFLKRGSIRSQNQAEADSLQQMHLAHLGRMYELGYADISGPFGDDGEIRGITIYNVPTLAMADSLANMDPAVRAGRLAIEVHPWWAAKGFPLR